MIMRVLPIIVGSSVLSTSFAQQYRTRSSSMCSTSDQHTCCEMILGGSRSLEGARDFCIDRGCNQNICYGKPSGSGVGAKKDATDEDYDHVNDIDLWGSGGATQWGEDKDEDDYDAWRVDKWSKDEVDNGRAGSASASAILPSRSRQRQQRRLAWSPPNWGAPKYTEPKPYYSPPANNYYPPAAPTPYYYYPATPEFVETCCSSNERVCPMDFPMQKQVLLSGKVRVCCFTSRVDGGGGYYPYPYSYGGGGSYRGGGGGGGYQAQTSPRYGYGGGYGNRKLQYGYGRGGTYTYGQQSSFYGDSYSYAYGLPAQCPATQTRQPTPLPTPSPTTPSPTRAPTTLSPTSSHEPSTSSNPSLSSAPTESDGPTLGPSLTPCDGPLCFYEFVGNGTCADSQVPLLDGSDVLPYVNFVLGSGPSPSVCALKCTECVNGAVSNGSFRGFTLDLNGGNYCKCHLDEGSTFNPGAGCTNGYNNFIGRDGKGEIIGVFGGDTVCYKFILAE